MRRVTAVVVILVTIAVMLLTFSGARSIGASLLASAGLILYVDYATPVEALRQELTRLVHGNPLWKGQVCGIQVTDATEHTLQLRARVDAHNAGDFWNLRCLVREGLVQFLQQNYPNCLPRTRAEVASCAVPQSSGGRQ